MLERSFERDADFVCSAVRYMKQCEHAKIVHLRKNSIGFGFVTISGAIICNKSRVDVVLLHSTSKTKGQKLELYVMTLSTMEIGFSAASFFCTSGVDWRTIYPRGVPDRVFSKNYNGTAKVEAAVLFHRRRIKSDQSYSVLLSYRTISLFVAYETSYQTES